MSFDKKIGTKKGFKQGVISLGASLAAVALAAVAPAVGEFLLDPMTLAAITELLPDNLKIAGGLLVIPVVHSLAQYLQDWASRS